MKKVQQNLASFLCGFVFALGLGISGMTQPQKVIGFLNPYEWDPTLIFVMFGAVVTHSIFFRLLRSKKKPFLDSMWHISKQHPSKKIDSQLVFGSLLFGIGWGIGGYCPGPALTSISSLDPDVLVFVLAMIAGMICCSLIFKRGNA